MNNFLRRLFSPSLRRGSGGGLLLCLLCSTVFAHAADQAAVARGLSIFNSLYKELNAFYVDSINPQQSVETAINAMLDDIDPYTEYIPASDQEDFMITATGRYGGIGSYIMQRTDKGREGVYISQPYEGSPAARAGLRAGDRIIAIDGDSTAGWASDKVSARLKGEASTHVQVTVARPYAGADSILTMDIERQTIQVTPVPYSGVLPNGMGYIALTTFNEQSASLVRKAVEGFVADKRVKGIILDLRGNGGGLLESAVQVVGCFVPKGTEVLITRGRDKQSERIYKTTQSPVTTTLPLAVLIDGGSASSAEITAGALQDLDRAVLLGSRSFGKGLVQTTRQLPFGGLLKVTVAKYYLPSGRLIQEVDYSQRNLDGTYRHTPSDSTIVYHTRSGREVRGGAGITPDIVIKYPEGSRLVYNIVRDHWDFDFATRWAAEHDSIASPATFVVSDEMFDAFKRSIDPARFDYDKVCETGLEHLREVAKTEGYVNDETTAAFDRLASLLRHDLNHDLDLHRDEISRLIATELMGRYYYHRGQVEQVAHTDETIARAAAELSGPGYRALLKPSAK